MTNYNYKLKYSLCPYTKVLQPASICNGWSMRIEGHANPLLSRGRDAPARLSSTRAHDALTWVLDSGQTCAVEGASGSGKATAAALSAAGQAPRRGLEAGDKRIYDAFIWIECDASSRPANVAVLQHFLMRLLLRLAPELRKRSENDGVDFSPPTTVQDCLQQIRQTSAQGEQRHRCVAYGRAQGPPHVPEEF